MILLYFLCIFELAFFFFDSYYSFLRKGIYPGLEGDTFCHVGEDRASGHSESAGGKQNEEEVEHAIYPSNPPPPVRVDLIEVLKASPKGTTSRETNVHTHQL